MKTHLNLATSDLERSVNFYSTLLNAPPSKVLSDYALFITDDPGMELALDARAYVSPTTDAHYGIFVETSSDVDRAIERLQTAGLADAIEREETCCYANQSKVWATDPDGRRWEVYTVHEETQARNDAETTCCASEGAERTCCA
jgi:predicted enzyme related to lactoylglutathione lyase